MHKQNIIAPHLAQESLSRSRKTLVTDLNTKSKWQNALATDERTDGGMEWRIAILISNHLNLKSGRCNPSHETLARRVGCSERTSKRVVQSLIEKGYLECRKGGFGSSNSYTLTIPNSDALDVTIDEPDNSDTQDVTIDADANSDTLDVPSIVTPCMSPQWGHFGCHSNNEENNELNMAAATAAADMDTSLNLDTEDDFKPIFQLYPEKRRGDWQEALAAFELALDAGYTAEDISREVQRLVRGLGHQLPPLAMQEWLTNVANS